MYEMRFESSYVWYTQQRTETDGSRKKGRPRPVAAAAVAVRVVVVLVLTLTHGYYTVRGHRTEGYLRRETNKTEDNTHND